MGLVDKPAFTAGELDPSLWERTNLDKYRNGMAVARSWNITKSGSAITRQGRSLFVQTKLDNRAVVLYSPPGSAIVMEWGHQYLRVYNIYTWALILDVATTFVETDIPNMHFDTGGSYVYTFVSGKVLTKFNYATGAFVAAASIFSVPPAPLAVTSVTASNAPAGYSVDYAFTYVRSGEESLPVFYTTGVALPVATTQIQTAIVRLALQNTGINVNLNPYITEMRVYRRPHNGGAYGYIGSSTQFDFSTNVGYIDSVFVDVGGVADYTHQPPSSLLATDPNNSTTTALDPGTLLSNTGLVYQQRLILTDSVTDLEALYASQPGYPDNYYRNYPIDAASALKFKCGTSGYARILRLLDSDGLVAFTAAGIYLNQGPLSPDNITMVKKGKWIINPVVPPLALPGGVMFLDSMTNGVRNLLWSFQLNAFDAEEVSIYSNHLFKFREISTWNFQAGILPLLWVVFNDGTTASFTYEYNQQMQAWTRHDSPRLLTRSSCGTSVPDTTFFVVSKVDGQGNVIRYIEMTNPRWPTPGEVAVDKDYDKNPSCAYMDSIVSKVQRQNDYLAGTDGFIFDTTTVDEDNNPDWSGVLSLNCGTSNVFTQNGLAAASVLPGFDVDDWVFRMFDEDGSAVDLKLVTYVNANNITVQVDNIEEFPSVWKNKIAVLYLTFTQVTGLLHMAGEDAAVIVDGAVVASPYNDQENYPTLTVAIAGTLDLPSGVRAAMCHVGRPIIGDLETLDIDTVEQAPTLVESITVNKVYVKVKDAQGLYIGPRFPNTDGSLEGMTPLDSFPIDYTRDNPIIGNRYQLSQTKRYEVVMSGDYSNQGKICVRQVDPVHAEILSFVPDVEVLKRSDR